MKYPLIQFRLNSEDYERLRAMLNGDSDKINLLARELVIESLSDTLNYEKFNNTLIELLKTDEGKSILGKMIEEQLEKEPTNGQ